ncbi:unnamed protein product [Microthlaspi erraticum]|uniref:DNA damage-binding protein 1 n=1 Tax=Microthlaspi erraticum TaxID=1685480 RepID=A0A6D2I9Q0_9BRAS|nr:unnamed protein product [Microthlaspi erraticum]
MTKMSSWNYVATTHNPSSVSHSCVGNFTSPDDRNLILAKGNRLEIHRITGDSISLMMDIPIYGSIQTLQKSYPGDHDSCNLVITTKKHQIIVLQFDAKSQELITRAMKDVSALKGRPPDCREVIPFDDEGHLKDPFSKYLEEPIILDIKFLFGYENPTIAVLYQECLMNDDARYIKTYEIILEDQQFVEGPWSLTAIDNGAHLLIPVPQTLGAVLIIGEFEIAYFDFDAKVLKRLEISQSAFLGYGTTDGSTYHLWDIAGLLSLLIIERENDTATPTNLRLVHLGETSIASSISYLDNNVFFVGSSHGDSQLVMTNLHPDAEGSFLKVLKRYTNLGPMVDFCAVDLEKQGQCQVVTCSGEFKDGFLGVVQKGIGIDEQVYMKLQGIKEMWSLKTSVDESFDTFLVVSFVSETRVYAMNPEGKLQGTEIKGLLSQVQTLSCHSAMYSQLVQVTPNSVRLVSFTSGELRDEWHAPVGSTVNVATANASQVLLATGGGRLVYLDIGDGKLAEKEHADLEDEVSCLDINLIVDDDPKYSQLAAVGTCTEISVRVFSLPKLTLLTTELLGGKITPQSVLLCAFEGISYLLCALEDGHLFNFQLDTRTGKLKDGEKVSLGTGPITLRAFSSKSATQVFAASDTPTVISSSNEKLLYSNVNFTEVSHMCPFRSADFPNSFAFASDDEVTIGTIDDIQKVQVRTISLEQQPLCICHQKQTGTLGICSVEKHGKSESHFVRLVADKTFDILSTHPLEASEQGCSILSCSFTGDENFYYCVGTKYGDPDEAFPTKGRILVYLVKDMKLNLIYEKKTEGAVHSLHAFHGKLLAAIKISIQLQEWILPDLILEAECRYDGGARLPCVQTRGDFIFFGGEGPSVCLLKYKHEEGVIVGQGSEWELNPNSTSATEILDGDIYLGAENRFNLFTLKKVDEGRGFSKLEVVGEYHLGELVSRFRHGSLVMRQPDSEIPTVIFGTVGGMIGVIASLPEEQYILMEKFQSTLRKVIKGVGGLSHELWRSFDNNHRTAQARNFLDGDLIESFLNLSRDKMDEISTCMDVPVAELRKKVEELTRLH